MPQSKLAFLRYMLIDQMLVNKQKPYPTKEEMLEACQERYGVQSVSTIEKDLNAMRLEFEAPIAYSKRFKGYHYTDESFRLFEANLSEEQKMALSFVTTFLNDFKQLPFFEEFSDAVDKVIDGLNIGSSSDTSERPLNEFLQIEKSNYLLGSDMLQQLLRLTATKTVLQFHYQKFGSATGKNYTISPYLLKEYKGLWYLTGWVHDYEAIRTFAIDRVKEIVPLPHENFVEANSVGLDPSHYFRHCIGVSVTSSQPEKIMLRFTKQLSNYIKMMPLHSSQTIVKEEEEGLTVSLELVINQELKNLIMSYGQAVEVLVPMVLRKEISEGLSEALKKYQL